MPAIRHASFSRQEISFAFHCADATDQRRTYASDEVSVADLGSKEPWGGAYTGRRRRA
jgi:hypothetical protein